MQLSTNSPEGTREVAKKLIEEHPKHRIWLLEGELAAGKTQLVKGLATAIGINSDISSPTFAYLKEYGSQLAHYDLYRLERHDEELQHLISESCENSDYVVIEWPSRMQPSIDKPYLSITIEHKGKNERTLEITPHL
jgi:tRNA threonylcarbamoyladenosine biosynthesis protein TsaE